MSSRHTRAQYRKKDSITDRIRVQVEGDARQFWRFSDFPAFPATAVSQALSRLARGGTLEKAGKGLYYRPRKTTFGQSKPASTDVNAHLLRDTTLYPAGITAAGLLGFTTQNPARPELATTARSVSPQLTGRTRARVHTRRPDAWNGLDSSEAAMLDVLRTRGRHSELSPQETKDRVLGFFRDRDRFDRIVAISAAEPPRVRAMLGAIGQELKMPLRSLEPLRKDLNPLSRFDFGALSALRHAKDWQAK